MLEIVSNEGKENAKILVVGVGGGGNNTVDRMIRHNVAGVDFLCINTDRQQLDRCLTANTLQIGAINESPTFQNSDFIRKFNTYQSGTAPESSAAYTC